MSHRFRVWPRKRLVLALFCGCSLLGAVVPSAADTFSADSPAVAPLKPAPDGAASARRIAHGLGMVLLFLLLLVLTFLLGSFIFVRTSRRARWILFHKKSPPSPAKDVWSMHKLPPDPRDDPKDDEDDSSGA